MFTFWVSGWGERASDGSIGWDHLPGVTRDSILTLCKDWGEFKVTERKYTMAELTKAVDENRLIECFGAGAAAVVSPIRLINYHGKDYEVPLNPNGRMRLLVSSPSEFGTLSSISNTTGKIIKTGA